MLNNRLFLIFMILIFTLSLNTGIYAKSSLEEVLSSDITDDTEGSSKSVKSGDKVKVKLRFDENWSMNFKVKDVKSRRYGARLFNGTDSKHSRRIDLFYTSPGRLNFRLANKKISFVDAKTGSINNEGSNKDHWLKCSGAVKSGDTLKIDYNYSKKRLKIKAGDKIIADVGFKINHMPKPLSNLYFDNGSGEFDLKRGSSSNSKDDDVENTGQENNSKIKRDEKSGNLSDSHKRSKKKDSSLTLHRTFNKQQTNTLEKKKRVHVLKNSIFDNNRETDNRDCD